MAKNADWNKIKTEYISSNIGLRGLADKYGVSFSTLSKRSTREKWVDERRRFGNRVVTDAAKKVASNKSEQLIKEYDIACRFIAIIEESLESDSYILEGIADTKRINEAANALTKFMDIKRIIKGHQTLQEKQAHDIAVRRLKIEEDKAKKSDSSKDKEIKVILCDEAKEWTV